MASNLPSLKPGDLVAGRFRIVEMIGSGGFSVVYRAHQEGMNRFVALKVLKPRAATDAKVVERFRREALYASHLTHPNTITLFDYGQTDNGLFYIAMEYLVGMDLSVVVQRGDPMDLQRVWKILVQCCRSLAEAHRLGLIHRDLKPENIFLVQRDDGEFIKVLDFGVSKALTDFADDVSRLTPLTQEGTVFGTPLYMAPEQAMAEPLTPAADVYALGHIAFEMITGRAAYWDCSNPMDVMLRQVNDPPLSLPAPWASLPFHSLVYDCTVKDPRQRIGDASTLLEALTHEDFRPYMDPMERPMIARSFSRLPAVDPNNPEAGKGSAERPMQTEEVYRWEFEVLEDSLKQARQTGEPRLVLIRGTPGTGRSNLLRAFVRRAAQEPDSFVLHRQSAEQELPKDAGLEGELSLVMQTPLEGRGLGELKRLLRELYGGEEEFAAIDTEAELSTGPLSHLTSMRDTFLSRLSLPFRNAAEGGVLVWGIENLERVDTLQLAFLDRFFRDLQAHPAPVLIVATVHPDELQRKTGALRYAQNLLQASRPFARQLSLVAPGALKKEHTEHDKEASRSPVDELGVYGSYHGIPLPEEVGQAISNNHFTEPSDYSDPDEMPTERIDIRSVEDLLSGGAEPLDETIARAFDQTLGLLAQIGDEVPEDLWNEVSQKMLDDALVSTRETILDQAERFGILHNADGHWMFAKIHYAESLREKFAIQEDKREKHRQLADLLLEHYQQPSREQLRSIVHHLTRSLQVEQAVTLLYEAGERSFRALDFDAAREHFLQIQALLDMRNPPLRDVEQESSSSTINKSRIWLRLGEIHGALGEYGAAEDALKRAVSAAGPDMLDVNGRSNKLLGDLAATQDRHTEALQYYEQAQQCFRSTGMAKPFVAVTAEMGHCALMQGRPERAEELLRTALDNAKKLRDEYLIARLHRYLGQVLTRRANFLEAMEHLGQSTVLFETSHREGDFIDSLEELGNAAYAARQYQKAREFYTRAIAQSTATHVSPRKSPHLGLARALAALSNLDQAEAHLAEAYAVYTTANEPLRMAEVQLHLGDLFVARSEPHHAKRHYEQVVNLSKSVGYTRLWLDAIIRQAHVAFDMEREDEVYQLLTRAAEMAQATGARDSELQVRAHIIYFQLLEHGFPKEGDTFSTLLATCRKLKVQRTPILCSIFRADVASSRGEYKRGRELLRVAYSESANIGDYPLFIPIARRDYLLQKTLGQLGDPHLGAGFALGAMIPPEVGRRRFGERLPGGALPTSEPLED